MGTFTFSEDIGSWEAGNWILRAVVTYAESKAAGKACLRPLREAFDRGENSFDFKLFASADATWLASVIRLYVESGEYKNLLEGEAFETQYRAHLLDLVGKLDQLAAA